MRDVNAQADTSIVAADTIRIAVPPPKVASARPFWYRNGLTTPNVSWAAPITPNTRTKHTKTRLRTAPTTVRALDRTSMGERAAAASISGRAIATMAAAPAASLAINTKTARQETNWTSRPPTPGASTGASPHAAPSTPETDVSRAPEKQSAATAYVTTMHVHAAAPCTTRSANSTPMLGAIAQPTLVRTTTDRQASSTGLRPRASDSTPIGMNARLIPSM